MNVETAEDPNALLGIEDNSGTGGADVTPPDGEGTAFLLTDTEDTFSDISVEVLTFDGDPTQLTASVEPTSGGSDFVVRVSCGNSNLNGDGTLTVGFSASSPSVSVELERTTQETVRVRCRGGGGGPPGGDPPGLADATASPVTGPGPTTQQLSFTPNGSLKSGNTVEISLDSTGFLGLQSLDYGEANVSLVDPSHPQNSVDVVDRGGHSLSLEFTNTGKLDERVTIEVTDIEIGETLWGYGTGTATFTHGSATLEPGFVVYDGGGSAMVQTTATTDVSAESTITIREDQLEGIDYGSLPDVNDREELVAAIEASPHFALEQPDGS